MRLGAVGGHSSMAVHTVQEMMPHADEEFPIVLTQILYIDSLRNPNAVPEFLAIYLASPVSSDAQQDRETPFPTVDHLLDCHLQGAHRPLSRCMVCCHTVVGAVLKQPV